MHPSGPSRGFRNEMKRVLCLALAAVLCAFPLGAQIELVRVRIQVALVESDLSIRPVPRLTLVLEEMSEKEFPAKFIVRTGFDGKAELEVPPGQYRLFTPEPVEFQERRYSWEMDLSLQTAERSLELSNDNAKTGATAPGAPAVQPAAVPQPPPAPGQRRIAEETLLFQHLRNGVVTVEAELGHGSGFIADPGGIVLTNQHVIRGSKEIRVQFDRRKVEAVLLTADAKKDIAALWVDLSAYPEHVVLPLHGSSDPEPPVVEGEKVIAIGSPLHQRTIVTSGIVSKVEDKAIISDVNANPGNSGGPLINSLGKVVGIVTFVDPSFVGPGVSGVVRIEEAEGVLREARAAMRRARPPSAALLPVEPEQKFPVEGLEAAITVDKFDAKPYFFDAGKYDVALVTPVLTWYVRQKERIEAAREKEKSKRKKEAAARGTFDPLDGLRNWAEYVGRYEAVVQILATPEIGETGGSLFWRSLAAFGGTAMPGRFKFKADFYEMVLSCDGREVTPIKRGKIEHVAELPKYYDSQAHYTYQGFYSYPYDIFSPGRCGELKLAIYSEEDLSKPEVKTIDTKRIARVWGDFESYRRVWAGRERREARPALAEIPTPSPSNPAPLVPCQHYGEDFGSPDYFGNEGVCKAKAGRLEEAILDFRRALEIDPYHANANRNIALAYYQTGQYDLAWRHVRVLQGQGIPVDGAFLQALRQAQEEPQ